MKGLCVLMGSSDLSPQHRLLALGSSPRGPVEQPLPPGKGRVAGK